MWLSIESKKPVYFAIYEGEILWVPGETEVADVATIYI